jgi:hypothetical protein
VKREGEWFNFRPSPLYPDAYRHEIACKKPPSPADSLKATSQEETQPEVPQLSVRLLQYRTPSGGEVTWTYKADARWGLWLLYGLYYTLCTGRWGQTPGKWLLRLLPPLWKVMPLYIIYSKPLLGSGTSAGSA